MQITIKKNLSTDKPELLTLKAANDKVMNEIHGLVIVVESFHPIVYRS